MRLNEKETQCVRVLAKWFESNRRDSSIQNLADFQSEGLDVDHESLVTLLKVMQQCGTIERVQHAGSLGGEFLRFDISPHAVQIVRELDEQKRKGEEPMDLVEQMRLTLRRKPFIAWPLMVLLAIVFLATAANQIISLLRALHLMQ